MTARKPHRYEARREDRWWLISVPELELMTQARELRDTDRKARSIVSLHLDVDPASFNVVCDHAGENRGVGDGGS